MLPPKFEKGRAAGIGDGESRRDAARRAVSGQLGNDPIIAEHGYGADARRLAKPDEPEPASLSEARRLAARRAINGGANSLAVPQAVRDAHRREATLRALHDASDDDLKAMVGGMDGTRLEILQNAITARQAHDLMDELRGGDAA